jgi:hypothetical protein
VSDRAEPDAPIETQKSPTAPPPLPDRLLALPPIVYVGTAAWFVVLCALLIARYVFDALPPIWLWTALAGTILGFIGMPVMAWQRRAARRGARGAQQGIQMD